jgi:hypothetical protein
VLAAIGVRQIQTIGQLRGYAKFVVGDWHQGRHFYVALARQTGQRSGERRGPTLADEAAMGNAAVRLRHFLTHLAHVVDAGGEREAIVSGVADAVATWPCG